MGKKSMDLFQEWGGGSEKDKKPEWAPVSDKPIEDFEPGEPKFKPEDVEIVFKDKSGTFHN